eukprot:gene9378-1589_t
MTSSKKFFESLAEITNPEEIIELPNIPLEELKKKFMELMKQESQIQYSLPPKTIQKKVYNYTLTENWKDLIEICSDCNENLWCQSYIAEALIKSGQQEKANKILNSIINKLEGTDDLNEMFVLGKSFYLLKKYEEAVKLFTISSEKGNPESQNHLAICYDNGRGVAKSEKIAFDLYKKSAESGFTRAQNNLAYNYEHGEGTEIDLERSFHWYKIAAENDNVKGQFNVAVSYDFGQGVLQNTKNALYWYTKAAESGHRKAQYNLAISLENGEGIETNLEKSCYWYRKSAENGHPRAQFNLGMNYSTGLGVKLDKEEALLWFKKSSSNGHTKATYKAALWTEEGIGSKIDYYLSYKYYITLLSCGDDFYVTKANERMKKFQLMGWPKANEFYKWYWMF